MSVVRDILSTYRSPRSVLERRVGVDRRDDRALVWLISACALIFVAQWPRLAREAWLDPSIDMQARLAGALFAWVMVMPLFFYVLAFGLFLVLKAFGGTAPAFQVRATLFWALLASCPLWLLSGLIGGFIGAGAAFTITSTLSLVAIVGFTWAGLMRSGPNERPA